MSLIVLPAAAVYCPCGQRLAPHPLAARRMNLPSFENRIEVCSCTQRVIRGSGLQASKAIASRKRGERSKPDDAFAFVGSVADLRTGNGVGDPDDRSALSAPRERPSP